MIKLLLIFALFLPLLLLMCEEQADAAQQGPERFLASKLKTRLLRVKGTLTGEGVYWHAAWKMGEFMKRFRASGDRAWASNTPCTPDPSSCSTIQ